VFDAGLDVGIGGFDEAGEGGSVRRGSGFQLDVAHEFAGTLQEMSGVGQECSVEEPDVGMRGEYIDVSKGNIAEAGGGTAVVQELADLVSAVAHGFEPVAGDRPQFAGMLFHPNVDGWVALDRAIEAEQLGSHGNRRSASGIGLLGVWEKSRVHRAEALLFNGSAMPA
jgi:hypothetical protein